MYHSSPKSPWPVQICRQKRRGGMFENGHFEPIQPSFSSASTMYEREPLTNARAERAIKRKPLPQSTFVPSQFSSDSVRCRSPPTILGVIRPEYDITRLAGLNRGHKGSPHFESVVPVSACSCCRISYWDQKLASPPVIHKATGSGKPARAPPATKKSSILRYLFV